MLKGVLLSVILLLASSHTVCAALVSCTQPASAATAHPIRLVFGGDMALGNNFLVPDIPSGWDQEYFAGVRDWIRQADLAFANLEGVLSEGGQTTKNPGSGRQFAFRFPPRYADLLKREGFDVVNLANNHAFDFGETGLKDTESHLNAAGIAFTGQRGQQVTLEIRGLRITLLGYSYSPRFASLFEQEQDAEEVRQAKARGEWVIVTFHAGAEGPTAIWHENQEEFFLGENRGNVVAFAHAMVDAGADLVIGHGPHVLRAIECYQGRPIAYSLGNLVGVGGLSVRKMAAVSALLEVEVTPEGKIQALTSFPLRFSERKLPEPDPRAYGTRLINYLGHHAKFPGDFVEFPVDPAGEEDFLNWFKEAAR